MKKSFKLKPLILLFLIIAVISAAIFCGTFAPKTASANTVDNNYRFNSVSVDITVNKDKTMSVKETLEVNFLQSGINTGIIRDIQRISKTTRIVDGKKKNGGTYIAGISDVAVTYDGGYCKVTESLYSNDEFYAIKMQQPSDYIDSGVHTFVLSYKYDMSDDKVRGFDDFTFDVLGYEMNFTNKFDAKITFPEDADLSNVTFRTNDRKTWKPDSEAGEYARVDGKVISIHANPQRANKGYTVQVILPDGYFNAQKTFYWYYIIFAAIAFAGIAVVAVIFIKCVIHKRPIETVEFYPPEGMSVMRFASIWKLGARPKHVAALILKWAGMGIIKIEAEGSTDCLLKPVVDPKAVDEEGLELSKKLKKPAKECFDTEGEEKYFNTLFSGIGGEGLTFSTTYFKRYARFEQQHKLYYASKDLIDESDVKPTVAVKDNSGYRTAVLFLCLIPTVVTVIYFCILNATFLPALFLLFMVVGNLPILHMENFKIVIPILFPIAFYFFPFGMLYALFGLTAYDYCYLMYIAPVMWALGAFVLRWFMPDRRTPFVLSDYGRMRGFKNFLLKAELPRIQVLFDDDPFYFAEILPYCYIMGISEKVQKRFAPLNVPVPEYLAQGVNLHAVCSSISHSNSAGAPRSSGGGGGGGGGHGGSSGGGGGGGGSRGC